MAAQGTIESNGEQADYGDEIEEGDKSSCEDTHDDIDNSRMILDTQQNVLTDSKLCLSTYV